MKTQLLALLALSVFMASAHAEGSCAINQATLQEADQSASEIATGELRRILAERSAKVFDARPYNEYVINHIPGAIHVGGKPGSTSAHYTTDAQAIVAVAGDDKASPIVVYCSGPYCGRSKRAADDLVKIGYTEVRRYQLGMPVWRALGGVTEIELDGVKALYGKDQTAVWLDARESGAFQSGTLKGARNLSYSGVTSGDELKKARKDGRLPVEDHNTRVIVFGQDGAQARAVAEALTRKAFHNVAYFSGDYQALQAALR